MGGLKSQTKRTVLGSLLWMWKQNCYWQLPLASDSVCSTRFALLHWPFWFSARRGWERWFGALMSKKLCFLGARISGKLNGGNKWLFISSFCPFCAIPCCVVAALCSHVPRPLCVLRGLVDARLSLVHVWWGIWCYGKWQSRKIEPWCFTGLFVMLEEGFVWSAVLCAGWS